MSAGNFWYSSIMHMYQSSVFVAFLCPIDIGDERALYSRKIFCNIKYLINNAF